VTINCIYCDRKCACGGTKKVVRAPKGKGEVETKCSKCGNRWLHWHRWETARKVRGTARVP